MFRPFHIPLMVIVFDGIWMGINGVDASIGNDTCSLPCWEFNKTDSDGGTRPLCCTWFGEISPYSYLNKYMWVLLSVWFVLAPVKLKFCYLNHCSPLASVTTGVTMISIHLFWLWVYEELGQRISFQGSIKLFWSGQLTHRQIETISLEAAD